MKRFAKCLFELLTQIFQSSGERAGNADCFSLIDCGIISTLHTSEELFIVVVSGKSVFNSRGAIMFWELRIRPGEDERKVYAEAEEYGIICKVQDLQGIAERLDKYIKKTKVRGGGLTKYIGCSHLVNNGEKWYEWSMGLSCSKEGRLSNEQGRLWYFELMPNRHYHLSQDIAEEVYEFPDRKDIIYYFVLVKYYWYYEENGKIVYTGDDEARKKREAFFQGLFDCIGFPIETLYTYPKESRVLFSK